MNSQIRLGGLSNGIDVMKVTWCRFQAKTRVAHISSYKQGCHYRESVNPIGRRYFDVSSCLVSLSGQTPLITDAIMDYKTFQPRSFRQLAARVLPERRSWVHHKCADFFSHRLWLKESSRELTVTCSTQRDCGRRLEALSERPEGAKVWWNLCFQDDRCDRLGEQSRNKATTQ